MSGRTQALQEHIDTYFGGNTRLFEAIDIIDQASTDERLDVRTHQEYVFNRWLIYLGSLEDFPTLIERFWWSVAFESAGMSFVDLVMKPYIRVMVEQYWDVYKDGFQLSKKEGLVPDNVKTAEEYLALVFAPPVTKPHTNAPVLQVPGLRTPQELEALSFDVNFRLAKMVVDSTIMGLHNASFYEAQREVNSKNYERDHSRTKARYKLINEGLVHERFEIKDKDGVVVEQGVKDNLDILSQIEARLDLNEAISIAKLSPTELCVVQGMINYEIPMPRQEAQQGEIKAFCDKSGIPHKGFYIIQQRALDKLKKFLKNSA